MNDFLFWYRRGLADCEAVIIHSTCSPSCHQQQLTSRDRIWPSRTARSWAFMTSSLDRASDSRKRLSWTPMVFRRTLYSRTTDRTNLLIRRSRRFFCRRIASRVDSFVVVAVSLSMLCWEEREGVLLLLHDFVAPTIGPRGGRDNRSGLLCLALVVRWDAFLACFFSLFFYRRCCLLLLLLLMREREGSVWESNKKKN